MTDAKIETSLGLHYRYKLTDDANAPLIYLIHGRAGTYDVMWTFERCLPTGCNIIAPQAMHPDPILPHSPRGLSWWLIGENREVSLESRATPSADKLRRFVSDVEVKHNLSPRRRIAVGFSQGAALISLLAQLEPSLFYAAAILAGFIIEREDPKPQSLPHLLVLHGSKDEIVSLAAYQRGLGYLAALGNSPQTMVEDVGHKIGTQGMKMLKEWLLRQAV